ncbi:hypothetical protein SH449x_003875 [Pirellulaceae bacterium SH449]
MELKFTIGEPDYIAFSEQYYRDSPAHQRQRKQVRWLFPFLLLPIYLLFTLQFGFSWPVLFLFTGASAIWGVVGPSGFPVRIEEVGTTVANEAYRTISQLIERNR